MIHDPYGPAGTPNQSRIQFWMAEADHTLLRQNAPLHGDLKAVAGQLIKNLCNDLRIIQRAFLATDSSTIMSILLEPRPLTDDQRARLRLTSAGTSFDGPKISHFAGSSPSTSEPAPIGPNPGNPVLGVSEGRGTPDQACAAEAGSESRAKGRKGGTGGAARGGRKQPLTPQP